MTSLRAEHIEHLYDDTTAIPYERYVVVSNDKAKLLKRADGRLVFRSLQAKDEQVSWYAPHWADRAVAQYWESNKAPLIRLLRRAINDPSVRDALIAAIEANLVWAFAKAQR